MKSLNDIFGDIFRDYGLYYDLIKKKILYRMKRFTLND